MSTLPVYIIQKDKLNFSMNYKDNLYPLHHQMEIYLGNYSYKKDVVKNVDNWRNPPSLEIVGP
ncbi:hypothetical protein, partial [Stenotrophomonas maltophilia group sp. RNC7]|uniref:hypothetical protein n=1 Tax=Stenotrophomonas maltophilia group sp. RNC7 TaxID=3071467 RepID=UPI0027E084F5